ncbi:MAG: SusC/RagA family TonB-linked outer membrane protein [Bacteroidaceae bacterium]|nr:SusC/RagA family TonB-linked outer membrane protein [Bacteroidaceae bacterium]
MEKRLIVFLGSLFLCLGMAIAQTQVKGTVISADDGEPLPGASVKIVGEKTGTITDANGDFVITVPDQNTRLEISHIGMLRRIIRARNGMRIALDSDESLMTELMVVAFGQQTKESFTGSAVVLNSDDLKKKTTSNVANALVGEVAGLQMTGQSGAPGAGAGNIYIRGISSLYSDVSPLIIVDGAPYYASLTNINSDDIESVTVLKDAASAALYGAAGAAGVILVTTKKGRTPEAVINVDMKWGANTRAVQDYETIQDPAQYYETYYGMMNNYYKSAQGYSTLAASAAANNATLNRLGYNVYTVPEGQFLIGTNGRLNPNATLGRQYTASNGETYYLTPDNWTDAAYKTALRQEYNVNVSAGTTKSSFYASAGYLKEDGIIEYSDYERFNARLKADYQAKKWLKVGANIGYTHSNTNSNPNMSTSWGSTNLMYLTTYIAPIFPIYVRVLDENGNPVIRKDQYGHDQYDFGVPASNYVGTPTRGFMSTSNPLGSNRYNVSTVEGHQLNQTYTADVQFTDWLRFNSTNNINLGLTNYTHYDNPYEGPSAGEKGKLTKYQSNNFRQDYIQTLNFHKLFGLHDINVTLGHEWNKTRAKYLEGDARNGFSAEILELNAFGDRYDNYSYTSEFNREGWFANALYNYDERYFLSGAFRRDASSYFDKDHRWGNFWSAGAAWLIQKENFFQNLDASWVDQLKLKFSIGQQGNDGIGSWFYTNMYSLTRNGTDIVPSFSRLGNKEITWETTTNINVGLEFSFWRGRLTGSFDYYNKKTTDLLFWLNIPESYGTRGYYSNIGDIRNQGVELTLNGDIVRSKDITWNVGLNLSHNKGKILKLPESKIKENGGFGARENYTDFYCWYEEGGDMLNAFIVEYAGVNEEGQELYWYDADLLSEDGSTMNTSKPGKNHSGTTTDYSMASRYAQGSTMPKLTGGFNTTLKVYNFDFNANFDFQLGGKVFDSTYQSLMAPESGNSVAARTWHLDVLNSWTPENTGSDIPRFQYNDQYTASSSTRFLTSARYLNFQSFSVGYTLPQSFTRKLQINKLRFYVQGQNLCFWSVRKGFDPRYSYGATANTNVYSPVRTISGGVQVSF